MADAPERHWYRGDFHVHTRRSHAGELTAEEVVAAASDAGLDFIAITEHNTVAEAPDADDDLLVIPGQEVVTESGHWLEIDGLRVVAHPYAPYPSGTFRRPLDGFDLVEVWNGRWASDLPWQADNETALTAWARDLRPGQWRPAIGNSDTHQRGQIGTPQTVVLAERLSRDAVLAAARAGHCWIAESAGIDLTFVAGAAQIGERLETGGADVTVTVKVSGVPSGTVTLHTDRGAVYRADLPPDGSVTWLTNARTAAFVRAEVRHPGGRPAALTNPIMLA